MKYFLIMASVLFFINQSMAAVLNQYDCKGLKNEPDDPTPVPHFRLIKEANQYSAYYSPDIDKAQLQSLAKGLTCDFYLVEACEIIAPLGECINVKLSELNSGSYSSKFLFKCAKDRILLKNIVMPDIEINASGKVSVVRNAVSISGFNLPEWEKDVFNVKFEHATNCIAKAD